MFLLLLACTQDPTDAAWPDSGDTAVDGIDVDQDGYAADEDCDDRDASVNPGAAEVCDGLDNDCNDLIDDQPVDATPWWVDQDGDGWGGGDPVIACELPPGVVTRGQDCDDGDAGIHPEAQEVCDEADLDEDCDGLSDDADSSVDPAGFSSFFEDSDGDGLGDPLRSSESCDPEAGQVSNSADCDDSDAEVEEDCAGWAGSYSGAFEVSVSVPALGASDTCKGSAEIHVSDSTKTEITGMVECSFSGILVSLIGADWDANITGGFLSEDTALGDLELIGLITTSWEGEFSDDTLVGELKGSATYEGIKVTYSGGFEVSR